MALLPRSASDVYGLQMLPLDLPVGSEFSVDAGFTSHWIADALRELDGMDLQACHQRNAQQRERREIESRKSSCAAPLRAPSVRSGHFSGALLTPQHSKAFSLNSAFSCSPSLSNVDVSSVPSQRGSTTRPKNKHAPLATC